MENKTGESKKVYIYYATVDNLLPEYATTTTLYIPLALQGTDEIWYKVVGFGGGTFSGCNNLVNVIIEEGFTSLPSSLFQGCKNLKSVIIPNTVTEIGDPAFAYCTGLSRLDIPSSVISIQKSHLRILNMYIITDQQAILIDGSISIKLNKRNCTT